MSQSTRTQYEKLLIDLHHEMRAGRANSWQAEDIRQKMDAPWYELTEQEQEVFDDLSEDLYIIEGKRVTTPIEENETVTDIRHGIETAFRGGDFRLALSLLRKVPNLDAGSIETMAQCWAELGYHRASVCFYQYASVLRHRYSVEFLAIDTPKPAEFIGEIAEQKQIGTPRSIVNRRIYSRRAGTKFPAYHPLERRLFA
jgi:hypothetical protein